MSLYELDKNSLAYIDHWWSELSDFTAGRLKKMIFEKDTIFYLTYQTSLSAPYYNTLSGGIMKLNSTY